MGGSAIGGDIIRSYCEATPGANHLRIKINRNYTIPKYIDENTLVICSSYSGNTEETISGFLAALEKTKKVFCISTGGKLSELASDKNIPVITIPGGLQPRCAIVYSVFPVLLTLVRNGAFSEEAVEVTLAAINELGEKSEKIVKEYGSFEESNPTIQIAKQLLNKITIVYSSSELLDTINLRWRGQIQENAKALAFGNVLPEMNHNEINGWQNPDDILKKFVLVFLQDPADDNRLQPRYAAMEKLLGDKVNTIIKIERKEQYALARMFTLLYFGDWVSYHLALLYGEDPTPIPLITRMKDLMSFA
jgi:glucose/mannose-6-phosphate isomerase